MLDNLESNVNKLAKIQVLLFHLNYAANHNEASLSDSSSSSSASSNQFRKHIIDLKVEPVNLVRFQGIASLAPENIRSDAAEVAGTAKTA